ncbi:MAG: hypothetical protein EOO46_05960 [Flavobacterium sp.]|nr:MAG: hypothetical protein EOO46_05960 [Flavobacterium sp.]
MTPNIKYLGGEVMGELMEELSLRGAAQAAGVSENTMREWVKTIPGVVRQANGGYSIPKESLMGYLASKQPKLRGPRQGGSFNEPHPQATHDNNDVKYLTAELVGQLKAERDRLSEGLNQAHQRIKDLEHKSEQRIKDLEQQNNTLMSSAEKQMRELSGTIANLANQLQLSAPREQAAATPNTLYTDDHIIDAEHEHHDLHAVSKVKPKVKSKSVKKPLSKIKTKQTSKKIAPLKKKASVLKSKKKKR